MTIPQYLEKITARYVTGISREHSYRGDLQTLLETIVTEVLVTNEPSRIACGAPDYVLTKKDIPVGYIEAKDIGDPDLDGKKINKSQFDRYKASLNNLIFTDYLDFHFYIDGELKTTIQLAEIENGKITPKPENFGSFVTLIKDFATHISQTIKSANKLSQMMAGKAKMLAQVIEKALNSDEANSQNSTLKEQMLAFKEILIHDITPKAFADIYAQTIAYGMFAARFHDNTPDDFSRFEAASLIPKSNPFLRKLFQYISGYDIDDRIEWIVAALADIFRATDVKAMLTTYGKATQSQDPIIHFYENFLAKYDPKLRKARGVWYTPEPVVDFIVRAVDYILKTEFNLPNGLADNSKTKIKVKTDVADSRTNSGYREVEQEVHKVQILDPATGTGTFLAQVITHIYNTRFKSMQGVWSSYVEKDLIPRLNGFELLMASYAMAHLKLDLLLSDTGYKATTDQRFRVYLTNSLEEYHPDTGTLFANWLSSEANEANHIKRDTPVMVVMGNPPYSGESSNKGKWIMDLMEDYKKEPGGKQKLQERNPKWINDDYVKFIRYGQHFIEKNGEGVLAFINPHGYLDNPTFRGMRWNLLKTYDKIYTIDLHGNSKKKEITPDGGKDENVFDIMQGVSINVFVKTGKKKTEELAQVYHYDLYGKRNAKYKFLSKLGLNEIPFAKLPNKSPMYFMVQKDFETEEKYLKGFSINELFPVNSVGIVTARDNFTIHSTKKEVVETIDEFLSLPDEQARITFQLGKDVRDWKVSYAKKDLQDNYPNDRKVVPINYRPFDSRWTFYTGNSKGFHCYPRGNVMYNFVGIKNIGLSLCKQFKTGNTYQHFFISNDIIESSFVSNKTSEITSLFPLYLYTNQTDQQTLEGNPGRVPNFNMEIIKEFEEKTGLHFFGEITDPELDTPTNIFTPENLLHYIYAVLHSPTYRETYKEFLKIDFPRVPFPKTPKQFYDLEDLGRQLKEIHLLESEVVNQFITTYPIDGDNIVTRKITSKSPGYVPSSAIEKTGRLYINDTQYFDNIPLVAWEFYIGSYQPAQKWLKDRQGRELTFDDILHYQKIIVALTETDRIMGEIDKNNIK